MTLIRCPKCNNIFDVIFVKAKIKNENKVKCTNRSCRLGFSINPKDVFRW